MTHPNALHGDGINFAFFNLLWSKSSSDEDSIGQFDRRKPPADGVRTSGHSGKGDKSPPVPILRVPDTVVFLFGQPHQWYFTSKNGGPDRSKTTILRKRRANLTLENIAEVFLNKSASRGGAVGEDDVVAYFINSSSDATEKTNETDENARPASLDACNSVVGNEVSCNIEYLNKKTLQEFLQHGRKNKSGILQRFIAPHGGGRHNSQIRSIWTPKLCILERRRTKQDLHDTRFALYERAITFDGPDVHSVSLPLRGTVLAGKVENICDEIVRHITDVAVENTCGGNPGRLPSSSSDNLDNAFSGVARMIVNFKVDGNGKIWILWSNSIRLQRAHTDGRTVTTEADPTSLAERNLSQPLNMDTVVKLPSTTKLTQAANHNAQTKLENKMSIATCPSCYTSDSDENFHSVPYKTIIHHFEKTLEMLNSHRESHPSVKWPPENRFIQAAGGAGFGALPSQLSSSNQILEDTHVIPPVIRQIQPKLRVKGYRMYRNDSLFLHKECQVCENCFLAYAKLAHCNFLMTRPINPFGTSITSDTVKKEFSKLSITSHNINRTQRKNKKDDCEKTAGTCNHQDTQIGKDFGNAPELPPAIIEPPQTANTEYSERSMKEFEFDAPPNIEEIMVNASSMNLGHMLTQYKDSQIKKTKEYKTPNPYKEDLGKLLQRS